jgi:hypothetical protein
LMPGLGLKSVRHSEKRLSSSKAGDRRAGELVAGGEAAAALRERARLVLAGVGMAPDDAVLSRIVSRIAALGRDIDGIQGRFLDMGRNLAKLLDEAGEGGMRAIIRAGLVPLSEAAASKLRRIAQAVDDGLLPADRLPRGAEAAYVAATLPAEQIERLVREDVLRPEVTAKRLRDETRPAAMAFDAEGPLTPYERRQLERRAAKLEAELARIRATLAQR